MATTKEINRITNKAVDIDKILCGGGIVYPYYKYRWKKYSIGYEERQRDVLIRTPRSELLAQGDANVVSGTFYLNYDLSNGNLIKTNSTFKYMDEGDFTFYTTGQEYSLTAGFYECRKSSFRRRRYDKKEHDYIIDIIPKIELVAELTVGKEAYKVEAKGNYIDTVGSNNSNDYPKNGIKNGYWYELIE